MHLILIKLSQNQKVPVWFVGTLGCSEMQISMSISDIDKNSKIHNLRK